MATSNKNMSEYSPENMIDISERKIGIVVSEYNNTITESLYNAAVETLLKHGITEGNIVRRNVPGAFELTLGAQYLAVREDIDGVVTLGCVIQGETRHFDFICQAIAQGITKVSLETFKPVSFGVLTPNTLAQAQDRAGGKHGNKGVEAAVAVIKILGLPEANHEAFFGEEDDDVLFF